MKEIPLGCDHWAKVDDSDYDWLAGFDWRLIQIKGKYLYARTCLNRRWIMMHVMIMAPAGGVLIDHRNGDGLDNQRSNLRPANHSQNNVNSDSRPVRKRNVTGYKGVVKTEAGTFMARIVKGKKVYHLGTHPTADQAAAAYNAAAIVLHGEYARLNAVPT